MEFGFDHAHFLVRDVRVLTEYFERVFDFERTFYAEDHKGAPYAVLRLGEGSLRIRGYREDDEPDAVSPDLVHGLDHVGFAVDDVEASVRWLEARGAEVLMRPEKTGISGRAIAFIRGPENIRIEICERPKPPGRES